MLDYNRFKIVNDLFLEGQVEKARLELAGLQRRYVALCDENTTLRMQIQEYEDILYLARNLVLENDFYWLITGSIKQGPFCPHCYNREGLLMRLSGEPEERFCSSCRETFVILPPAAKKVASASDNSSAPHEEYLPQLEKLQRKAKVIPFGK